MIRIDKIKLDRRCEEIARDLSRKKFTSSSWLWIGIGALGGLVASCLKIDLVKKGIKDGFTGMYRNSKTYKRC